MLVILQRKRLAATLLIAVLCGTGCATKSTKSSVPLWLTDPKSVYTESAWVVAVESSASKQQAQSAALGSLATMFTVDVNSVKTAQESISSENNKYSNSASIKTQTDTNSNVLGLMGVQYDTYKHDSAWYALARMNRKEGSRIYSAIIKENDNSIKTLLKQASDHPKTFTAYEALGYAYNIAILTDNYMNILSVLDADSRDALKLSYGNATAVHTRAVKTASEIVIDIRGELTMGADLASQPSDSGRIAKAFAQVFSKRNFKTTTNGKENLPYILTFDLRIDKADLPGNQNKFARYTLKTALNDEKGEEILSSTVTDRSGHLSMAEAVQRAIRDAELVITETGFAAEFDEYLASLLKGASKY
ncbi:MAG: hypothetical protein Ta2B_03300 [Termitinemataceae bacterium]|nr:MAG: hypothetical protein Ta2B_03300 [Termitinemataceae bacterium]